MSLTGLSNLNADVLAGNLFTTLTTGADFSPPVVDLSGAAFTVPSTVGNELYAPVEAFGEGALTDRTVGGTGMFDGLMEALNAHLLEQFMKGRLTGDAYAAAYVQLTQTALGNAVQYLLADRTSYFQAIVAQKQAQTAEIGVIVERVRLEISKAELAMKLSEMNTAQANYALTKLKLSTEDANYAMTSAQRDAVVYSNTFMLPAQLIQLNKQVEIATADIALKGAQVTGAVYNNTDILPAQKLDIIAGTSGTTAQKDQTLYQTANILPAQKSGLDAENAIKAYQLATQMPAQTANVTADTAGKVYNNTFLLPEQLLNLLEQTESHRAKTLNTRRDGITPVVGAIGKQKDLQQQQIDSYKRDAETKLAKMLLDTWTVQKTVDEGLTPPASITDANINTVMGILRTNLDLV